jgi:hypothetical protein
MASKTQRTLSAKRSHITRKRNAEAEAYWAVQQAAKTCKHEHQQQMGYGVFCLDCKILVRMVTNKELIGADARDFGVEL